jgi:hypothetical protein
VIFPVPVTLKRFLALEFVFTFGILNAFNNYTFEAFPHWRNPLWASSVMYPISLEELPLCKGSQR